VPRVRAALRRPPYTPAPRRPPPSALDFNPFKTKKFSDLRQLLTAPHPVSADFKKFEKSFDL
jgi:hypothetical protein